VAWCTTFQELEVWRNRVKDVPGVTQAASSTRVGPAKVEDFQPNVFIHGYELLGVWSRVAPCGLSGGAESCRTESARRRTGARNRVSVCAELPS
jgi:hypothetical protein